MAKRLTDKKKKKIVADYIELENYSEVARRNKVSVDTVKRLVLQSEEIVKKLNQKKEQNTADILEHMERKRDKVCNIIDKYLDALLDDEKISKATPSQLTTALGTLIDKFTMAAERPENMADDPLTKSLKEEAERMEENADQ